MQNFYSTALLVYIHVSLVQQKSTLDSGLWYLVLLPGRYIISCSTTHIIKYFWYHNHININFGSHPIFCLLLTYYVIPHYWTKQELYLIQKPENSICSANKVGVYNMLIFTCLFDRIKFLIKVMHMCKWGINSMILWNDCNDKGWEFRLNHTHYLWTVRIFVHKKVL